MYTLLLGVGLLGLIASFHGIILVAGRATMEFGARATLPASSAASTAGPTRRWWRWW